MVNQIGAHAEDSAGGAAKNAIAARGSVTGAAGQAAEARRQRQANARANDPNSPVNRQTVALETIAKKLDGGAPGGAGGIAAGGGGLHGN